MKKSLVLLVTVALFFCVVGTASAVTYTDTYDAQATYMEEGYWTRVGGSFWNPNYEWVADATIGWTFDITDDGYLPGEQTVTSASIALNFTDDGGCWDWFEYADLSVGNNTFSWEVDSGNRSFTLYSLMTLSETGMVDAQLTATGGDFFFNSATLTAEATAPVPEPATLLLLGSGLAGLAFYRRKRK